MICLAHEITDRSVAAHTRKKRGHRKPLDPNLPRDIVRHELPEAERFCANDGHALVEFGVEISEQLTVIPEQLRVIQLSPSGIKEPGISGIWAPAEVDRNGHRSGFKNGSFSCRLQGSGGAPEGAEDCDRTGHRARGSRRCDASGRAWPKRAADWQETPDPIR